MLQYDFQRHMHPSCCKKQEKIWKSWMVASTWKDEHITFESTWSNWKIHIAKHEHMLQHWEFNFIFVAKPFQNSVVNLLIVLISSEFDINQNSHEQ